MPATYRAAVIGHTGRGNYGHGLDTVWQRLDNVEIVGVADPDPAGLKAAQERLETSAGYPSYHQMLRETEPDVVSICPRWLDQHQEMLIACARAGVRGVYCEKPLCRSLAEADVMVDAAQATGMKVAVAHQTRYSPKLTQVRELIESGKIGRPLEFRARGKEDRRGGGEDLWVLGTHVLNLTHYFGGEPSWCSAHVFQGDQPIHQGHVQDGSEGIGPLAGDRLHALYGLNGGAVASFNSVRHQNTNPSRFGLMIYGSEGIIAMNTGYLPHVSWLPDGSWTPARTQAQWIPVSSQGPGQPEILEDGGLHAGNRLACTDLIRAIEDEREPEASLLEARVAVEMIAGVFESHRQNRPVSIPLQQRDNPLSLLPTMSEQGSTY